MHSQHQTDITAKLTQLLVPPFRIKQTSICDDPKLTQKVVKCLRLFLLSMAAVVTGKTFTLQVPNRKLETRKATNELTS